MSPHQKAAWFNLIVFACTALLYLAVVPLLAWGFDKPLTTVAVPALGIFGLCGLWGFAGWFYRPRADGTPVTDERDLAIQRQAWVAGMGLFWGVFVLTAVGSWAIMRYVWDMREVTLPVDFFPATVFVAMFLVVLTQSVATLHAYGWRAR